MTAQIDRRTMMQGSAAFALLGAAAGLSACSTEGEQASTTATSPTLRLDRAAWRYDDDNDVYYQLGVSYVTKPQAASYETLGVYVPGAYLSAKQNSDGTTYTASLDRTGAVKGFRAATAPVVFPVNTPGYAAQKPPTSYSYNDVADYLEAGFVYVAAGLRGRDSQSDSYTGNAPWGVTDLKAAVRFIRYNASLVPGSERRTFVFGMSGGGAQSAVMGASGDSALYRPYLSAIGAAMKDASGRALSDAVAGVMAWCPITNLDYANAAYEWNMGQFASTGTRAAGTWTQAYSEDLARAFAAYQNKLGLKDAAGTTLRLARSADGSFLSGTYYDHLVEVVSTSLNHFLEDTTFPYTASSGGGMPGGSGGPPSGASGSGSKPTGAPPSGGSASGGTGGGSSSGTTYETVQAYIDSLNADETWVRYDASTKQATVLSLAGFVRSQKPATKDVGAFDGIDRGQTENVVMGLGEDGLHFSPVSRTVVGAYQSRYETLTGWKSAYAASSYRSDAAEPDAVGKAVGYRTDMYNPLYYLNGFYDGHRTATVATHWRIRTGIMQGDTASTTEVNLALALQQYGGRTVDFETVWGQAHTEAERSGSATGNFIAWVREQLA